jgi:hypothetical protein
MMGCGLALAFGIGCGAGMGASSFVVPPARAGTNPQKWEYSCFRSVGLDQTTQKMNQMGAQGWELIVNSQDDWCFKRPL